MPKLTYALKCGASALSLTFVLSGQAYAQSTTAPSQPISPASSEVRPATAGDKAPQDTRNPVEKAQTALPGAAAQTNAPNEAIIITGTSIRGVAPVGSNLISVGRDEIE